MASTTEHAPGPSGGPTVGPDPLIGKTIDGCKMVRKIGQGGMGVVYLAHQGAQEAEVCIKILNPSLVGSEDTVERFFREAQACAQLTHPSIVAIQNVGQDGEYYFIRMEYIDGCTLEELVRQKEKVDWKKATEYALATAEALAHAHQKGMIHRDIKPENVMLTNASEEVKVMDFGLAKHVHSSAKVSVTGQIVGTPFFMSPEQAGGKPTDARSDIYSLGVTLYYLVTGVKPFNGKNLQEIFLKHFFYAPESPKIYNPSLPESLCDVIRKCLKKKKKERYQSAKALANDLRQVLTDPNAKVAEEGGGKGGDDDEAEKPSGASQGGGDSEVDGRTVRAGPAAAEGEKTVRVGGEAEVESRTVRVGGDVESQTVKVGSGEKSDGEQPTVAVKGRDEGAAPGKRKKDVAQVQFRSASMVLDGKVAEKLEIDDEEDDPTAGIDLPTVAFGGQKPADQEQEKALAELQPAPLDKKKLIAVALVLLIPVMAYVGLLFASKSKLDTLRAKYDIVKTDPDGLRALSAEIDEFLAGTVIGVRPDAEALKSTVDGTVQSAEIAKKESDKLAAEEARRKRELEALQEEQAKKLARWGEDKKQLEALKAKSDWPGYTDHALKLVKEYADVPQVEGEVRSIQIPVYVSSDPLGASLFLGQGMNKVGTTAGVVWVMPNQPFSIEVKHPGFQSETLKGVANQFLDFDVTLKRSIKFQVDLGTVEAPLGNRMVQEELIPINEPQLDGSNGLALYFVGHDGRVRGASVAKEGRAQQLWGNGHEVGFYGDPVPALKAVPGGVVIVPSLRGQLSVHDPANGGQRIWTAELAAAVTSPPAYVKANGVIAVGLDSGEVAFLSDTIGQEQWRFQTENAVVTAPFFLGQNLVFIGSTDDRVYAVDWRAQKMLGSLDLGGDVVVGPLPFGRHLVVGTATGSVCVIDGLNPEQLRLVARVELGKAAVRGLAVEDNMIYATTGNELRAVRVARQGGAVSEAWQRPYASPTKLTSPTASDGMVYVGAQDGILAALDGATGDLLWKYRTEGRGGIRHPVIVLDNELYVISGNKVTVLKAQ